MKRLLQRKNLLAALVFFALIAVGGIALKATGNWENPFAAFSNTMREGGPGGERGSSFAPPDSTGTGENASDTNTAMERPNMGEGQGGHESSGITWSQFGHVLYNIWFLFTAAGVVMLISIPMTFIRKALRQRNSNSGRVLQESA